MTDASKEFATAAVPSERTVAWYRVGIVSAMVAFSLPTFITGLEVALVTSGADTFISIVVGCLILTTIGCITGSIGALTGLSSYLLSRIAFGTRGAAMVNLAFAVSLLGWFGVNIDLFSGAVLRLLEPIDGIEIRPWVIEAFAGLIMTITTLYGFRAINLLALLLVPVLMVVTVLLISTALSIRPLPQILAIQSANSITNGEAISAVVGGVIVGAVILPDITRFINNWRGSVYTVLLSYLLVTVIVMAAGGLAAMAQGSDDLLDIMIVMGMGWAAFAIVILGSWVLNSLNLYSTSLSIEATFPSMNEGWMVSVLGVVGTLAAFLNILDYFIEFLVYLAIIFVPVAGVIAVDYFLVRRSAYHEKSQDSMRKFSLVAIAAWFAGVVTALLSARFGLQITQIAALDAMLVSAAAYWLLSYFDKSLRQQPNSKETLQEP